MIEADNINFRQFVVKADNMYFDVFVYGIILSPDNFKPYVIFKFRASLGMMPLSATVVTTRLTSRQIDDIIPEIAREIEEGQRNHPIRPVYDYSLWFGPKNE